MQSLFTISLNGSQTIIYQFGSLIPTPNGSIAPPTVGALQPGLPIAIMSAPLNNPNQISTQSFAIGSNSYNAILYGIMTSLQITDIAQNGR